MENALENTVKFAVISILILAFAALTFAAGFGTAYLLSASTPPATEPPTEVATPPADGDSAPTEVPPITPIPPPTPTNEDEEVFQLFWEVWGLIEENYYGELPDLQEVTYGAIYGMIETLDDNYTYFVEPEVAAMQAEDATGEYQGIGAWVGTDDDGRIQLAGIFENSPAEEAGLQDGDIILAVDGTSLVGSTVYEAIALIRGPEGTDVILLVERDGVADPFEVTVTRARIETPVTEAEILDGRVAYIRLYDFQTNVASQRVEEDLQTLLAQEPVGLIFDLRGNPGGQVNQAVQIADLFLDEGVVLIERWSDGSERKPRTGSGDIGEQIPMVLLVDGGSASAAEILAGALQDRGRATLIGETTFGKGVVQIVLSLTDGSELAVTAASWYTPNDRAIHEQGLTPDIEVPWPAEGVEPDEDPQLDRAVEYLTTGE